MGLIGQGTVALAFPRFGSLQPKAFLLEPTRRCPATRRTQGAGRAALRSPALGCFFVTSVRSPLRTFREAFEDPWFDSFKIAGLQLCGFQADPELLSMLASLRPGDSAFFRNAEIQIIRADEPETLHNMTFDAQAADMIPMLHIMMDQGSINWLCRRCVFLGSVIAHALQLRQNPSASQGCSRPAQNDNSKMLV